MYKLDALWHISVADLAADIDTDVQSMGLPMAIRDALMNIARSLPHPVKYRLKKWADRLFHRSVDMSQHSFSHEQHPLDESDPVSVAFHKLGPWFSEFRFNGKCYGGLNSYENDGRISQFFQWVRPNGRVLELGAFEGAQSLQLAANPGVDAVLALEGRGYLIEKAEYIKTLYQAEKISFRLADLEVQRLSRFGRFDAVFCSGLLYHMTQPWKLIHQMTTVADRVFISTHYAAEAVEQRGGYGGQTHAEYGYQEPLSGLGSYAFWLTLEAIEQAFEQNGYYLANSQDFPEWPNGPVVNAYFLRKN